MSVMMLYLIWCLSSKYIKASGCNSKRCPEVYIGDQECHTDCMSSECNYDSKVENASFVAILQGSDCASRCLEVCSIDLLVNNKCDSECNIPECVYDLRTCGDCATECFDQMLGNGICNEPCNNENCEYDRNDCGRCDEGCYLTMLGNGNCDEKCYTARCEWDLEDCYDKMCAPGCSPSMVGNSRCNEECKVPDCQYDQTDCFCDSDRKCSLDLRKSPTCQEECNLKECSWQDRKCGDCNSGCYFDMIDNGHCEPECNVEDCKFDFPDCEDSSNPNLQVMYVTTLKGETKGLGTRDSPYTSLYIALTKVSYSYTAIYLLEGDHYLNIEEMNDSVVYDVYDPLAREDGTQYNGIYISTALCSKDPNLIGCAEDSATIYVEDKIMITMNAKNVVITKVIFRGDHLVCNLDQCGDCSVENCRYCPFVAVINDGKIYNDKIELITAEEYQTYGKECKVIFRDYSLLKATNTESLIIKDVKFSNFLTWQDSLISFSGSELYLISVDFEKIQPGNKEKDAVVKVQFSASEVKSRSFHYIKGSVKYLNNGYQINPGILQGGFLYIEAYTGMIEISDIIFSFNIVQNINSTSYIKPFIYITGKDFNIIMEDLTFTNNYVSLGLIYINLEESTISTAPYSKVKLSSILSSKNSSEYGLILFKSESYLVIFEMTSVVFDRCLSTQSAMIQFTNVQDTILSMTQAEFYRVYMDYMLIRIENMSISDCYTYGNILKVDKFFNLEIFNFNITNSGDSYGLTTDLVNEYTLNDFLALEFLTLQVVNQLKYKMNSSNLVYLKNIYKVSISEGLYASNKWSAFTIFYIEGSYSVKISDLTFQDLKKESLDSSLIKIISSTGGDVTILNCFFTRIFNQSSVSSISIYGIDKVLISNISMNNTSANKGNIRVQMFQTVKIDSCIFNEVFSFPLNFLEGNILEVDRNIFTNTRNSSGSFGISCRDVVNITILNTSFTKGSSSNSSAIYTDNVQRLIIDSCTFSQLSCAEGYSAAIRAALYRYTIEDPSLEITNSTFSECDGGLGIGCIKILLTSRYRYISLKLTSLKFYKCRGQYGSAIYIDSTVAISSSIFKDIEVSENYNSFGGPIEALHSDGILNMIDCNFYRNSGAVAALKTLFTVSNQLLSLKNIKVIDNYCSIAGIQLRGTNFLFKASASNVQIINNTSAGLVVSYVSLLDSDSIYDSNLIGVQVKDYARVTMRNAKISNNANTVKGGGAYIQSYSHFECIDCKISSNKSNTGGGIMIDQEASVSLIRTELSKNIAEDSGSALYIIECKSATSYLEDCDISENRSASDGSIQGVVSTIQISNSRIRNNISNGVSPGIVLNYSRLTLYNTTMQYQESLAGSFLFAQTKSVFEVENCIFSHGMAREYGGAVVVIESKASFVNSEFRDLYSYGNSAGILVSGKSDVTIENCRFFNLTSTNPGSVVFSSESSLRIENSTFKKFEKVGIYGSRLKVLGVYDSTFEEGTGDYGGTISCTECSQINVLHSRFQYNNATSSGGGLYFVSSSNSQYLIQSCYFIDNNAEYGGAVYIDGGILNIKDSLFLNNTAKYKGGSALMKSTSTTASNFTIQESSFQLNTAEISGGAIYWGDIKPLIDNHTTFLDNTATYGDSIASFPIKMQFIEEGRLMNYSESLRYNPLGYILNNIPPGQYLKQKLEIALVDHYGQIVNSDSLSSAEMFPINPEVTGVTGINKVIADQGNFTLDNIQIFSVPSTTIYLEISTSAIESNEYYSNIYLEINLRDCVIGESTREKECKVCDKGTYSLDPQEVCKECPVEAECLGNFTMFPREHYWRSHIYSDKFYKCPNQNACLGSPNYQSLIGECEEGYRGNMCQACQDDYSRSSDNMCSKCLEDSIEKLILSLVSLAIVIYCIIMVKTSFTTSYVPQSLQSMYIKILTNYLQLVGITVGLGIPWPKSLLGFFDLHQNSGNASNQAFSFDCILETSDADSYIQVYYKKMIVIAFIPLLALLVCIVIWSIISIHKKNQKYLKIEMVATIVILFFFLHPKITQIYLSIFSCREIEGEYYLNVNLDIECWKGDHLGYALGVALPCVIIWVVGVPFGILMYMTKNRTKLRQIEMKLRFGFLYNGYKLRTYYWEFIILYRNVIMIMILEFLSTFEVNVQALAALIVILLSYYYHTLIQPYRHHDLNELDKLGIFTAAITIYLGLYFLTNSMEESSKVFLFLGILFANVYFLAVWVSYFGNAKFKELTHQIHFLRKLFNQEDGYSTEFLQAPKLNKSVYLEEDQMIMTLVNPENYENQCMVPSIPNSMLNLYRSKLFTECSNIKYESLSDELYFTNNWYLKNQTSRSSDTESFYQFDGETISTLKH